MSIRLLQLLLAGWVLAGCTFFFDVQDGAQLDPAPPDSRQKKVIFHQIYKITESMKLPGASEISDIGANEAQSGPEKWAVCLRSSFPTGTRYFTFFLKGETVVNSRPSVINDRCEGRTFSSFENSN